MQDQMGVDQRIDHNTRTAHAGRAISWTSCHVRVDVVLLFAAMFFRTHSTVRVCALSYRLGDRSLLSLQDATRYVGYMIV